MDGFSAVESWLLKMKSKGLIKVIRQKWPEHWQMNLHDFEVQLFFYEQVLLGRGTDSDPHIALVKATMEAIERAICVANGLKNSSGVAIHFDESAARKGALAEYLERQVAINFFSRQTGIKDVTSCVRSDDKRLFAIARASEENNLKIQWYCLGGIFEYGVTLGLVVRSSLNGPQVAVGFGCDQDFSSSAFKATIEALRTMAWIELGRPIWQGHPVDASLLNELWSDRAKLALGAQTCFARELIQRLTEKLLYPIRTDSTSDLQLDFHQLKIPDELTMNVPTFAFRVQSA